MPDTLAITEPYTYIRPPDNSTICLFHESLKKAMDDVISLDPRILLIEGLSGLKFRLFLNHLIRGMENARYLEIGTWTGSTLCSAINGNKVKATAIDNWSNTFDGPKEYAKTELLKNLTKFQTPDADVTLIEKDFRTVDYESIGKFNVYMYDGEHEMQDQYDGLRLAMPALDDEFIYVVDDWNIQKVRDGTRAAIFDLNLMAITNFFVLSSTNGYGKSMGLWHNGYFCGVMKKPVVMNA